MLFKRRFKADISWNITIVAVLSQNICDILFQLISGFSQLIIICVINAMMNSWVRSLENPKVISPKKIQETTTLAILNLYVIEINALKQQYTIVNWRRGP